MLVQPSEVLSRLLANIESHLHGLEHRPRMYAGSPESLWSQAYTLVMLRQSILRPRAMAENPGEVHDAFGAFDALVLGEIYNVPAFCILRDEGRLDMLPSLLGDTARWIAIEYPPETARRHPDVHAIRWRVFGSACVDCGAETCFVNGKQFFKAPRTPRWKSALPCTWSSIRRAQSVASCPVCNGVRSTTNDGLLCPGCGRT